MMRRQFATTVILAVCVLAVTAGCGSGNSAGASLADFETRVPDSIARHVPLPEGASVRMHMTRDEQMIVMFSPGVSWPEALAFFSNALDRGGWTLESESLPEYSEGEREANWSARGHGHQLSVVITAFGGEQGFNMTGLLMLQEDD